MLQSSGLANTPYLACLFEVPAPKHPNGPPGTVFWEEETKGPKTLTGYRCAVSETGRSRTTPPIRRISHAARNSPVARDCVVGPRGLKLRARHAVLSNESPARPGTEFRRAPRQPTNEPKCRAGTEACKAPSGPLIFDWTSRSGRACMR